MWAEPDSGCAAGSCPAQTAKGSGAGQCQALGAELLRRAARRGGQLALYPATPSS